VAVKRGLMHISRACRGGGFPPILLHDLRHTSASLGLAAVRLSSRSPSGSVTRSWPSRPTRTHTSCPWLRWPPVRSAPR
jgi:hypothetical protein